jgi:hypothetical protein
LLLDGSSFQSPTKESFAAHNAQVPKLVTIAAKLIARNIREVNFMLAVHSAGDNARDRVALNEGLRCKKRLWRERGREQLESFPLAPWASRRRHDVLELLDRLNPTIAELTRAIEQEVEKCPAA